MKLKVDPEADALYLRLDDSRIIDSEEVAPGVVLDYNEQNQVVGVEILSISKRNPTVNTKAEIQQRVALGELLSLEIDAVSVSSLAGKYGSDSTLRQISDEAYQLRDAEPTELNAFDTWP